MKHTPELWEIEDVIDSYQIENCLLIARVNGCGGHARALANARLYRRSARDVRGATSRVSSNGNARDNA